LTSSLSLEQALRVRTRAQLLDPRSALVADEAGAIAQRVCGVQAQDAAAGALSLRVRSTGLTAHAVESARLEDRTLVRTWAMRGTLHLVASADLAWLLALLGPVFIAAGRRRRAQLGLDDEVCAAGVRALRAVLDARGPLNRSEIVAELAPRGIRLEGQAIPHLIAYAALQGVICTGPDRHGRPAYVLTEQWLSPRAALPRGQALAQIALRHLEAYGPTGPADLAAWSGLPMTDVREAWRSIGDRLIEFNVEGRPLWMARTAAERLDDDPAPAPVVRLLPRFDTYLLGYKGRADAVAAAHGRLVNAGGGILNPTLLVDGRVLGLWVLRRAGGRIDVTVQPFGALPPNVSDGIESEVADIGRFLGMTGQVTITVPC
jgi:hypothetical protein